MPSWKAQVERPDGLIEREWGKVQALKETLQNFLLKVEIV
jgi:hypothetical protein